MTEIVIVLSCGKTKALDRLAIGTLAPGTLSAQLDGDCDASATVRPAASARLRACATSNLDHAYRIGCSDSTWWSSTSHCGASRAALGCITRSPQQAAHRFS